MFRVQLLFHPGNIITIISKCHFIFTIKNNNMVYLYQITFCMKIWLAPLGEYLNWENSPQSTMIQYKPLMVNDHRACLKHRWCIHLYRLKRTQKLWATCFAMAETKALAKHCGFEDWVWPFIALLQLLHSLMSGIYIYIYIIFSVHFLLPLSFQKHGISNNDSFGNFCQVLWFFIYI